jgi:hypothetical protein
MDNAINLKLYNGDISVFYWANFFANIKGAVSITIWLYDTIILYEICAIQISVFQEIMQFLLKVSERTKCKINIS